MKFMNKPLSWNKINNSHRLMFLIVLALGLLNFFWGEKVPAGGGFGWDGVVYANMVRNLNSMISGGELSSYYAQRILPSAMVRIMLLFARLPMSNTNIIRAFELYNLILLMGACWAWMRVGNYLSLSVAGRWIGFSGIFINFAASKHAFYYPVLTDVTAIFIAMLLLLFYVERKIVALLVTTIIGAFCWPVVSVCGAFLLIFMGTDLPGAVVAPPPSTYTIRSIKISRLVRLSGLVVLTLSIIGYITLVLLGPVSKHACNVPTVLMNAMSPRTITCNKLLTGLERLFTALPSLFGLLVALAMLAGSGSFFPATFAALRKARLPDIVLAVAAVLIPFAMVRAISNPAIANVSSLPHLIKLALLPPEGKFLLPVVTLGVYWGPLGLLLILYWKAFCIEARKLGPGVVAIIAISLALALVGEPRFITVAWPFLVLGLVLVLEASSKKASFKYVLAALTVLYAQFWMKLNLAPWLSPDYEELLTFPKQVYFMHMGLWMSWWAYCLQLIFLILSAIWLRETVLKIGVTGKGYTDRNTIRREV